MWPLLSPCLYRYAHTHTHTHCLDQNFQKVNISDSFNEEKSGFFGKFKVEKGSISECVINVCIISYGIGLLA